MNSLTAPDQFNHDAWDIADLSDRVRQAARVSWYVENWNVIHLSTSTNSQIRSLLQALGLEVTNGSACADDCDGVPVITVCATEWAVGDVRAAVNIVQATHPEAIVCILNGFASRDTSNNDDPVYSDARALFVATGISFFSWGGDQ